MQPSEDGSTPPRPRIRDASEEPSEFETEVTATDYSATEDDVESLAEHEVSSQQRYSLDDISIPQQVGEHLPSAQLPPKVDKKPKDVKKKEPKPKPVKIKDMLEPAKTLDNSMSSEPLVPKPEPKISKQNVPTDSKVYLKNISCKKFKNYFVFY